jgi:nicotinate phosphoribosyltransferase
MAEGILYTDFYQFTMAHVYFRAGLHESPAQFDHFFRSYPDYGEHKAGYCVNAGMEWLLDWMEEARFGDAEIDYLRSLTGSAGSRLFPDDFLGWLRATGGFDGVSMKAIPEGRVVHPDVPLTVVTGPLAMVQILESPLLNLLNYPTLVATKAARLKQVGRAMLFEFGMRRAPERGASAGARAALIGGADFSSNTGISSVLGHPPKGTHAHSMVAALIATGATELDAFRAYADVYPDDCVLLVDTIDTLASGLPNAITVFRELRKKGHAPLGVRLDSGDLAYLAIQAAKMLDEAGLTNVHIVLSNQLDELVLLQIHDQIREEAPRYGVDAGALIGRLIYGVGTRLISSKGDAALDGVYKLVALKHGATWRPTIKLSETPAKVLNPDRKRVWRLYDARAKAVADLISLESEDPREWEQITLCHPAEPDTHRTLRRDELTEIEPLLVDVMRDGKRVGEVPPLEDLRKRCAADVERLDAGVRRIVNPHRYHVSVTESLRDLKRRLAESVREEG